jgi:hypothetical protein
LPIVKKYKNYNPVRQKGWEIFGWTPEKWFLGEFIKRE